MTSSPRCCGRAGGGNPGYDLAHERVTLDLAGRGERELREQLQPFRQLVGRDGVAEEGDETLQRRRRTSARHQAQAVALAQPRVRDADDRGVEHLRMGVENLFDLARKKLLAAAVDHFLEPTDDAQVSL